MDADLQEAVDFHQAIVAEGGKALVGYEKEKALANMVLMAEIPTTYDQEEHRQVNAGNLLLRGVPGVGKTFFGVILAAISGAKFARLGQRRNAKAFVVVSDGQAWSGEVSTALELARSRDIRVYVVGVGTTAGGIIPDVEPGRYERRPPPIHSVLDRRSLRAIATAGGGKYYELGAEPDHVVALRILNDAQQFAERTQRDDVFADLYWGLLVLVAGLVGVGTLLLKERAQLVGKWSASLGSRWCSYCLSRVAVGQEATRTPSHFAVAAPLPQGIRSFSRTAVLGRSLI